MKNTKNKLPTLPAKTLQWECFHFLMPHKSQDQSNFFILGVFGVIEPRKKFDLESSSEVHKMLGCLNHKYKNCIFICQRCSFLMELNQRRLHKTSLPLLYQISSLLGVCTDPAYQKNISLHGPGILEKHKFFSILV